MIKGIFSLRDTHLPACPPPPFIHFVLHQKKVTVHFRSYTQIGGPCDCGVPVAGMQGGGPLGQQQLTRRQLAKLTPEQRARQAAASKAFEAEAKRAARAAELGEKRHVPRCRCQGTLQRKIFDKYVDPLDGMIRVTPPSFTHFLTWKTLPLCFQSIVL